MKKLLFILLSLILAIGIGIPVATPAIADTYQMVYLGMNEDIPGPLPSPFEDDRVREAVYITLDRDAIAASQGGGKVVSIATPSLPNPYVNREQDLDYALDLLAVSGYKDGFITDLYTTPDLVPLADIISDNLLLRGIIVDDVIALEPSVFSEMLSNRELPFFLTSTSFDSAEPQELLGRLLLSDGIENYTGYNTSFFDLLFGRGQYRDAETSAFDANFPFSTPIVPLFWETPFHTVKVGAVIATGSTPELALPGVPITWDKTGGMAPDSGEGNTFFSICQAAGDVTLTAPLNYSDQYNYLFENWVIVIPQPSGPPTVIQKPANQRTIIFTADANKTAIARYQLQIGSLGSIYPVPDVNPVGTKHTVWVDLPLPISGVKVIFNINGANSAAAGCAYSNATGRATFIYTGDNAGIDIIWAYIDSNENGQWDYEDENGNGEFDTGEPCEPRTINQTSKSWIENYITGAGQIKDENKNIIWEFNFNKKLRVLPEGGVAGHLQIVDYRDDVVTYNINQFSLLSFYGGGTGSPPASNNTVRFRGTGTGSDGSTVTLVVIIEDANVGKDKIAIVEIIPGPFPPDTNPWIGYIPIGVTPPPPPPDLVSIDGGNFQIHNMK